MNEPSLHPGLAQGRWFAMTLAEQMGNIGSEYGRAWSWKEKNQPERFQKAFDRMLDLLDMTLSDPRWKNHRLKELTRVREEACGLGDASKAPGDLRKYFTQFATVARKNIVSG